MAGGKETGRQKMVGMMYLVLTALLALNVSSTVIDKFVFLDDSLVRANRETEERNITILENIVKTVDDTGNRDEDVKIVTAAQELRAETDRVLKRLTELKGIMVEITQGYEEGYTPEYVGDAKNLIGKTDYDKVGHYMMPVDEGGEGVGAELKELLNGYVDFAKKKVEEAGAGEEELIHFLPIALDADEDPIYSNDPNQKGKPFSTLAFDSSPTPAALATMSEFQSRVLGYETRGLDYFKNRVGAGDLKFDVVVPMVKPESKYVTAGTKYTAELFIAASSSGVTPTMTYNGNPIPVDGSGKGLIEFTANASNYDKDGVAKLSYEAAIKVTMPGGRDTVFQDTYEYFVVRPTISIQSQSVNALYLNCGNKLDIQVPQLGPSYNPAFSAVNGRTYPGEEKGQVTIVPTSTKEVELSVSSSGNLIGKRSFGVRRIPAPVVTAFTDQGPINLKDGIPARTPRIYLRPIPDESFAQFLPDDAAFIVAEATITLVSGGLARGSVTAGAQANIAQLVSQARKGDNLVIDVKSVKRQNFRKEVEDFNNYNRIISIPLQ